MLLRQPIDATPAGPEIAGRDGWRQSTVLRRGAALAGFAFIMLVAIGLHLTQDWQSAVAQSLSASYKQSLAQGGLFSLIQAGVSAGLWMAWLVSRTVAIFGAFFLVEWALVGRPKSWWNTAFFFAIQCILVVLYYFGSPYLQMVLPTGVVTPLFEFGRSHLPALLGPLSDALIVLAMLVIYGFAGYWTHRAQHRIPFLWRFHSVHHSIEHMDALNDCSHPLDAIGDRLGIIMISALIGFQFETVVWILAFQKIRGSLLHSRAPINFGPLGSFFVDNRFHFSHHSIREKYYDRNYGGVVTFYDKLFGSYVAPESDELEVTGMRAKLPPRTPWHFFIAKLDDRAPEDAGSKLTT